MSADTITQALQDLALSCADADEIAKAWPSTPAVAELPWERVCGYVEELQEAWHERRDLDDSSCHNGEYNRVATALDNWIYDVEKLILAQRPAGVP